MARYIGASCKICRREGENFFLKGSNAQVINVSLTKEDMLRESMGNQHDVKVQSTDYA